MGISWPTGSLTSPTTWGSEIFAGFLQPPSPVTTTSSPTSKTAPSAISRKHERSPGGIHLTGKDEEDSSPPLPWGRTQAIQDGEVKIDIAVVAAPAADPFGNANGLTGPSATGVLSYADMDVRYATHVIVVTDNLVSFPCLPMQIEGNYVDSVVTVDKLGLPEKIIGGTTQITRSPDRLIIAEMTARFCEYTGIIYDGCVVQAGAGGSPGHCRIHAPNHETQWLEDQGRLRGTTRFMTGMLLDGTMEYILDGQVFDTESIRSLNENRNHIPFTINNIYNYHSKGNFAQFIDMVSWAPPKLTSTSTGMW